MIIQYGKSILGCDLLKYTSKLTSTSDDIYSEG